MSRSVLTLTSAVFVCLALPFSAAAQIAGEFRLTGDEDQIEAELVAWDFVTGTLTLRLSDGSACSVPASDLHAADTRMLERLFRKQMLAIRKGDYPAAPEGLTEDGNPLNQTSSSGNRTRTAAGIEWKTEAADAFAKAQGRDGLADDKPVVWFRVLGDLSGFM